MSPDYHSGRRFLTYLSAGPAGTWLVPRPATMDESTTVATPTVFADDLTGDGRISDDETWEYQDKYLERVLPRRCPGKDDRGYLCGHEETLEVNLCETRGWLYPDMPDWWGLNPDDDQNQAVWESHCRTSWRAMGILG